MDVSSATTTSNRFYQLTSLAAYSLSFAGIITCELWLATSLSVQHPLDLHLCIHGVPLPPCTAAAAPLCVVPILYGEADSNSGVALLGPLASRDTLADASEDAQPPVEHHTFSGLLGYHFGRLHTAVCSIKEINA